MRFTTLLQISAASIALTATALTASAQVAPITPGQATDSQIAQFVGDRLGALGSGEPLAIRNARTALLAPLRSDDADSSFRLQYSSALQNGGLARLATDTENLVAINAVVIAGELATPLSVNILQEAMEDQREAIRYEAARSIGVLLNAYDADRAAVPANQIDSVFRTIESAFTNEQSGQVVDALFVALAGPSLEPELGTRCATVMCQGAAEVAERWRSGAPTETQALTIFRAIDTAFADLIGAQGAADRDFAMAAAVASGQALVFFTEWMRAEPPQGMDAQGRQLAIDLGAGAERVLLLAHSQVTGQAEAERITRHIRDFVEDRNGARLAQIESALEPWTGARGKLLASPYNVPAGSFN